MINKRTSHNTKIAAQAFLFVFSLVAIAYSQDASRRSLLITYCEAIENCGQQSILKVVFQNDKVISQDVLAKLPAGKANFDVGAIRIINDRFVVSSSGEVFDLETKELYAERSGNFVGVSDNKVLIDQKDSDKVAKPKTLTMLRWIPIGKSLGNTFEFDLATKKYDARRRPNFFSLNHNPGGLSPDASKIIGLDWFDRNSIRIVLIKRKAKSEPDYSMEDIGKFASVSCKGCQNPYDLPILWLNNSRFITQKGKGALAVYDLTTRQWADLEKVIIPESFKSIPMLFKDDEGSVFFVADDVYKIDIDTGKYTRTDQFGLNNGFKRLGMGDVKTFNLDGYKIGSFMSAFAVSTKGYLAAEYQKVPIEAGPSEGVLVWNVEARKWTTLTIKFRPRIIGWLNS